MASRIALHRRDLVLRHGQCAAARSAQAFEDEVVAEGGRHPDAGCARGRVRPGLGKLRPLLESAHDRGATFRLHRIHARPALTNEPERLQLLECLPYSDQAGATAGRIDDRGGQPPGEILGQLETTSPLALYSIVLAPLAHVEGAGVVAN